MNALHGGRALVLLGLAARNVRRQARRSVLTASAMVLGLALLVVSRTLSEGSHEAWIESGVRMASGHIAFQNAAWGEQHQLEHRLSAADLAHAQALLKDPRVARHVRAVTVRLSVDGLASSAISALPVRIEGVDPTTEPSFSQLDRKRVEGRDLVPADRLAAYVGAALAERLHLHVGSRFVLTAQAAGGDIGGQLMRVCGTFRTGVPEVDEGLVRIPIETARRWLGTGSEATTLAVLLAGSRDTPGVLRALQRGMGQETSAGMVVRPWTRTSPELDSAVRIDDYGDWVFHAILLSIVTLAILNAVLMSVLYRRREFGILRALGLTPFDSGAVVLAEGVLLTLASGVVGMALGLGVVWGFWRRGLDVSALLRQDFTISGVVIDPVIIPRFVPDQMIQSVAFILLMGVVASVYPAFQAARIDPAGAMAVDR
jgi:ABC-type lipoprotein release transport system permease subunit